jgi:hypothetical protein
LLDRFRPPNGLLHADAEERIKAVERMAITDLALLDPVLRGDADPRVRRAAARRVRDLALLAEAATRDTDDQVREAASEVLFGRALEGRDEGEALQALAGLRDDRSLAAVARAAALESVARAAVLRLTDERALGGVARHGEHAAVRHEAMERLQDPGEWLHVALKAGHRDTGLEAVERIADPQALETVAARARLKPVARRARARLRGGDGEEGHDPAAPATDRDAQQAFIARAEALGTDGSWEDVPARLAALRDAWIEELREVDDDLDERFREACHETRRRLQAWQEERVLAERREREAEEKLGPRRRLCEAVEGLKGEEAVAALQEARASWSALEEAHGAEVEGLESRFLAACRAAEERLHKREQDEQEAATRAEAKRLSEEAVKKRADNLKAIDKLSAQNEALAKKEGVSLTRLERALKDVRQAIQSPLPLPSPKDHEAAMARLRALQAEILPKIQTLRDTDRWQRWANAAVQEELCARMEDLAAAVEAEGADLSVAGKGISDLMERWKAAGPAPPDRSLSLWNRFKAARDRVRERADAFYQQQSGELAQNLKTKEALAEKAEGLSASTDWHKTADTIKGLQAEWKTVGPVSRGHEKAIWDRFRKACDQFFAARDQHLSQMKDEWSRNLETKQALCEQAESLAASTEWKATADRIKKLQADWKAIGPVKRNQSEAIWNRFRAACDRFFERYKNRDAAEREEVLHEREALCAEIEALAGGAPPTALASEAPAAAGSEPPAREPSAPSLSAAESSAPEGELAAAAMTEPQAIAPPAPEPVPAAAPAALPSQEETVGRLRAGLERWRRLKPLPQEQMAPLSARFFAAFDRVLQAHPALFQGTSLDGEANLKRMRDLVGRIEKLVPSGGTPDVSGLTPGERLASMWREALATNTMGGRVADESRARAAAEEARKAQAAWQRLGYVPEEARRELQERFDRACRAIFAARGAEPRDDRPEFRGRGGPPRGGRPFDGGPRDGKPRDGRPRGGGPGGGRPGGGRSGGGGGGRPANPRPGADAAAAPAAPATDPQAPSESSGAKS